MKIVVCRHLNYSCVGLVHTEQKATDCDTALTLLWLLIQVESCFPQTAGAFISMLWMQSVEPIP